jgi:hypothetical protein
VNNLKFEVTTDCQGAGGVLIQQCPWDGGLCKRPHEVQKGVRSKAFLAWQGAEVGTFHTGEGSSLLSSTESQK